MHKAYNVPAQIMIYDFRDLPLLKENTFYGAMCRHMLVLTDENITIDENHERKVVISDVIYQLPQTQYSERR